MEMLKIIFSGFGGQGVLFMGKAVSYAGLFGGKEVTWMPSYGPEMRGGTANCSVCVSDEPIGSPLVTEPDVLVAMSTPAFDKFISTVKPGGKVIVDSSLVGEQTEARSDVQVYNVPATQMAIDEGLQGLSNMILLGKFLQVTKFTIKETLERAIAECVPSGKRHLMEPNLRAMDLGLSFGC